MMAEGKRKGDFYFFKKGAMRLFEKEYDQIFEERKHGFLKRSMARFLRGG